MYYGSHEVGHTFNLGDCTFANGCTLGPTEETIMGGQQSATFNAAGPTACDQNRVNQIYCPAPSPTPPSSPSPTPTPTPPQTVAACQAQSWYWNFSISTCHEEPQTCGQHCAPYIPLEGGMCESSADYCGFQWGCPYSFSDGGSGCCCVPTPVIIDVAGNGVSLTDAYNGVYFDMGGDGHSEPIAWTKAGTDDAWLVLDRNGNGKIDSAKEMFGNFTDQPQASVAANGFLALAEFDKTEKGGNGDGLIKENDSVFGQLRLWQDVNKNGISESSELHKLKDLDLKIIELDYKESRKTDQHANQFKYRAKVKDNQNAQMGRWALDVILLTNPPPR